MKVDDPVCKITIPLEDVVAEEEFGGWAYFFCSNACHARFLKTPTRYAAVQRIRPSPAPPGG